MFSYNIYLLLCTLFFCLETDAPSSLLLAEKLKLDKNVRIIKTLPVVGGLSQGSHCCCVDEWRPLQGQRALGGSAPLPRPPSVCEGGRPDQSLGPILGQVDVPLSILREYLEGRSKSETVKVTQASGAWTAP